MEMDNCCWSEGNYTSVPKHIVKSIEDIFSSFNSTTFCEDAIADIHQVEARDQNNKDMKGEHKWAVCIESPRLKKAGRPQVNSMDSESSQKISYQALRSSSSPLSISDLKSIKWARASPQHMMGLHAETALLMHLDNTKLWDMAGTFWHHHLLHFGSVYKSKEQGPGSKGSKCTGPLLCLGSNGTYGAVLAWPLTSVTWTMEKNGSASSHEQPKQCTAFELSVGPVKTGHLCWIFALDWKDLVAIPTKVVCPARLQHLGLHASSHKPAVMLLKVQPQAAMISVVYILA